MTNLSYEISKKDYNEKIRPYFTKKSESTIEVTTQGLNKKNQMITISSYITHFLKDNLKVEASLNANKNIILELPSDKDKNIINKLEKLTVKN